MYLPKVSQINVYFMVTSLLFKAPHWLIRTVHSWPHQQLLFFFYSFILPSPFFFWSFLGFRFASFISPVWLYLDASTVTFSCRWCLRCKYEVDFSDAVYRTLGFYFWELRSKVNSYGIRGSPAALSPVSCQQHSKQGWHLPSDTWVSGSVIDLHS